jgi:predicted nucleic acid-binding protein
VRRVFLDANVLFSAAWRDGSGLTRLWQLSSLRLVTSAYATEEAERNLRRKRPEAVPRLHALMRDVEIANRLVALDDGHGLPAKDAPILAGAVASHCAVLVTGDIADFGHLIGRTFQGVSILTASMLLAETESPPL